MKKLHGVLGLWMGSAVVAGCTNTALEQPFYPAPPPPFVEEPAPYVAPEPPPPEPAPEPRPVIAPPPAPAPGPVDAPAKFGLLRDVIREGLPAVSRGAASAIRFVNYTSSKRYTTMAMSDAGVVPLDDMPNAGLSFMMNESGERLALVIGSLKPGHYDCATSNFAVGFAFPEEAIDGEEASWSDRPGASCEFDLWEGENPGDVQGKFTGTLVTLEGHTLSISDGYFYARAPKVTPAPAVAPSWNYVPPKPKPYHR